MLPNIYIEYSYIIHRASPFSVLEMTFTQIQIECNLDFDASYEMALNDKNVVTDQIEGEGQFVAKSKSEGFFTFQVRNHGTVNVWLGNDVDCILAGKILANILVPRNDGKLEYKLKNDKLGLQAAINLAVSNTSRPIDGSTYTVQSWSEGPGTEHLKVEEFESNDWDKYGDKLIERHILLVGGFLSGLGNSSSQSMQEALMEAVVDRKSDTKLHSKRSKRRSLQ